MKEMLDIDPDSIALEMIDEDGQVFTCYYNVNANDRAMMIDGMVDDGRIDWVKNNKQMIRELLEEQQEEEEEEDEDEEGEEE